ncbi:MAG: hypothetical protein K0R39_5095 [Symbiobacteriaceae bacterium]|jgi:hypothetical protein|nr:hypothetical protein [Symbiobacteriaceae bacterium]
MPDQFSDEVLRRLTHDALHLYSGFDEVYHGHLVEAVMRNLPPEFDRDRVERVVHDVAPNAH